MRHIIAVLSFAAVLASSSRIAAQPLLVSAAASLTNVLPEVAHRFEQAHPSVHVKFNFASSGALQQQIEQGAPVDVFVSAAQTQMDALQIKKLIDTATRRNICADELVLIAPPKSTLHSWLDLNTPSVYRIAVGNPASVPAGTYSRQTLTALGLWDMLQKKFIFTESVRQALTYVDGGNVDAGIVYRTDALVAKHAMIVDTAMPSLHEPILYPAAVVMRSTERAMAKSFVEFLVMGEAQNIFKSFGFGRP